MARNITEVAFETEHKHRKGIQTEDSVIRILTGLCRKDRMHLLSRVIPPRTGECDAIVFSDVGLLTVEVKRFGGELLDLDLNKNQVDLVHGKDISSIRNPAKEVVQKAETLRRYLRTAPGWGRINDLFKNAGDPSGVPVFPVLCFGPTTRLHVDGISADDLLIGNTRNIRNLLVRFIASRRHVVGAAWYLRMAAYTWWVEGKLTLIGKAGFLRAHPVRVSDCVASFSGAISIVGNRSGKLFITYSDGTKRTLRNGPDVVFRAKPIREEWQDIKVPGYTAFNWKS